MRQLPTDCCGYEGVDAVILSTSRPEIYRRLSADDAQVQALDQWVRMGGRLVLCAGSAAEEILAEVASGNPDVLVFGFRRGGPPGMLEGKSIGRRLAHASPCATLTIPL